MFLNEDLRHCWKARASLTLEPGVLWNSISNHLFVSKLPLHYETGFLWELLHLQTRGPAKCVVSFSQGGKVKRKWSFIPEVRHNYTATYNESMKKWHLLHLDLSYHSISFTFHCFSKAACKLTWNWRCPQQHLPCAFLLMPSCVFS